MPAVCCPARCGEGSSGQDDGAQGCTVREDAGEQVGETERVDRFGRGAQFGEGPPAVFANAVGLRCPGRVDVGCGDSGEEGPVTSRSNQVLA